VARTVWARMVLVRMVLVRKVSVRMMGRQEAYIQACMSTRAWACRMFEP